MVALYDASIEGCPGGRRCRDAGANRGCPTCYCYVLGGLESNLPTVPGIIRQIRHISLVCTRCHPCCWTPFLQTGRGPLPSVTNPSSSGRPAPTVSFPRLDKRNSSTISVLAWLLPSFWYCALKSVAFRQYRAGPRLGLVGHLAYASRRASRRRHPPRKFPWSTRLA